MASTQASPQEGNVGLSPKECRIKIAKYGEALSVPTITTEVALDIFTLTYDPALVDSLKIRPVGKNFSGASVFPFARLSYS